MGSGKKGGSDIKDTPEQKARARVAAEQWNFAQTELKPLQDKFMQSVDEFDSDDRKAFVKGRANIGMQNTLTQAGDSLVEGLQARDIDLNSGKAKTMLSDMTIDAAEAGADASSRSESDLLTQKVRGLNNVVAMGSGQESQALAGLSDIASLSAKQAVNDAYQDFNSRSQTLQNIGTLAGAGSRYYMEKDD